MEYVRMTLRSIESILIEHPEVAEVCALREQETDHENPTAYVVLRPKSRTSQEQLQAYCAEQGVSSKVALEIVVLEELPRGPLGRVSRKDLPALRSAELAGREQKRAS